MSIQSGWWVDGCSTMEAAGWSWPGCAWVGCCCLSIPSFTRVVVDGQFGDHSPRQPYSTCWSSTHGRLSPHPCLPSPNIPHPGSVCAPLIARSMFQVYRKWTYSELELHWLYGGIVESWKVQILVLPAACMGQPCLLVVGMGQPGGNISQSFGRGPC